MEDVLVQMIACKQPFLSFFPPIKMKLLVFFRDIIVALMVGKVTNATNVWNYPDVSMVNAEVTLILANAIQDGKAIFATNPFASK